MPRLFYMLLPTPIGTCALLWRGDRVAASLLPEKSDMALVRRIQARFPDAEEGRPPPAIAVAAVAILKLLGGDAIDLAFVPLDLDPLPDFERKVYAAAQAIPAGETRTYGELARAIGSPGAARAVGAALGRNPFPIIVPCHRILAAGGRSGGFTAPGGVATKFRILQIEGAARPGETSLFDDLPLAVAPARRH